MALTLQTYQGAAILPYLDDMARLRTAVFRAFPYLYEGSTAYEATYLRTYASAQRSAATLARDGSRVVGVSTCVRLDEAAPEVQNPCVAVGLDAATTLYLGESVLLPKYRGRGVGRRFFTARETLGKKWGCRCFVFCAVERPDNHPARPADYRPLDGFWRRAGYRRHDKATIEMDWQEVGRAGTQRHTLLGWLKCE